LKSIASRLAPTGVRAHLKSGRLSGRLALAFDLGAPLTTMAGERACRALARHRVVGQSLLVPFCWAGTPAFEKGTRCKSETISGRYRRNGYVVRQHLPQALTRHGSTLVEAPLVRSDSPLPESSKPKHQLRLAFNTLH
jgi:hypothetical protein